jgi:hypothetical protein
MKFRDILQHFGNQPWFDFEMAWLASGETEECVHTELYRWRKAGKLIELRRGLFCIAPPWSRQVLAGWAYANPIYPPSYLTGEWVLRKEGILPAADKSSGQTVYTCATPRPARTFENPLGQYQYDILPKDLFFGVVKENSGGAGAYVADPEKSLLDYWFFQKGEWDLPRHEALGMDASRIDAQKLIRYAKTAGRPRLLKAAKTFIRYAGGKTPRNPLAQQDFFPLPPPPYHYLRAEMATEARSIESLDERGSYLLDRLDSILLRIFHEAGAFSRIALSGPAAAHYSGRVTGDPPSLDFVRLDTKGYSPEQWLFKVKKYLAFMGIEARMAFSKKGAEHSGLVKVYGLAAETGLSASPGDAIVLRLRFSAPEGSPANSGALARIEIASAQVKRGGERFAIRYVRNDVDNRSQAVDI